MKHIILMGAILGLTACGGEVYVDKPGSSSGTSEPTYGAELIGTCGDMRIAALAVEYESVTGLAMPCGYYEIAATPRIDCPGVGDCLAYIDGTQASFVVHVARATYPEGDAWNGYACSALVEATIFAQFGTTTNAWQRELWTNEIMADFDCAQ